MNIDELNSFAENLDMRIKEISGYLEICVTDKDINNKVNQIYNKLSKDVSAKVKEIYNEVNSNYTQNIPSTINKCESVYTKKEIDNKGFLTEHQSLENYVTFNFLNENYVKKNDLHIFAKCNCINKSDLTNTLKNYVTFKSLSSELDKYYTKEEVDEKINEYIAEKIPEYESLCTKSYVNYVQKTIYTYVSSNYLTDDEMLDKYLTIEKHNDFSDFVDETYVKKSEFEEITDIVENIDDFVKKEDLEKYALKSSIDSIQGDMRGFQSNITILQSKVLSLNNDFKNKYFTKSEISSNFYNKNELESKFLLSETAKKKYLLLKDAVSNYLTKKEAREIYLAIEDYKSLFGINYEYLYQYSRFLKLLEDSKILDGLYIIEYEETKTKCLFLVRDGKLYNISKGEFINGDVYTKNEIDNMINDTKDWADKNCKAHEWVMTETY